MAHQQNLCLSQLLPYDTGSKKNASLQSGLKEYQTLLKALFESTTYMEERNLEKFDSLVGENACQIRAIWMAQLASQNPFDLVSLQNLITSASDKVEALLDHKTISALMRCDKTLKAVLETEHLDIPLNPQELFMIESYLLAEMKTVLSCDEKITSICRVESADPKKLQRLGNVSTSFARHLLSKVRRMLATASVHFVRDCANVDASLARMVSEEFTTEQNTLPCIPMFWTYKTVLKVAKKEKIPLILHVKFLEKHSEEFSVVDEDFVFFEIGADGSYIPTQPDDEKLNKPTCVVQGIATPGKDGGVLTKTQWRASIKKHGVIDVILAGAADHRQFPDPELDHLFHSLNDCEYMNYRTLAKKEGFSFENSTTFFIQHVYTALAGSVLSKIALKKQMNFDIKHLLLNSKQNNAACSKFLVPSMGYANAGSGIVPLSQQ